MSNKIKINCRRVFDTGSTYLTQVEEIKEIKNTLKNISSEIANCWHDGIDSINFQNNFNSYIESMDDLTEFLTSEGALLMANALDHSNVDKNFTNSMRSRDLDD